MYTLFLDTHNSDIVLVLYYNGKVLDKLIKNSERNHTEFIMPMLDELLKKNNLDVKDLNEILVVNGPGSFTGVRLAVTIAKTLAYTLKIPIKTISSLSMYAVSSNKEKKLVIIRDLKGVFLELYDSKNNSLGEPIYLNNSDFSQYVKSHNYEDIIVENPEIDYNAVYTYSKTQKEANPHMVNPLYIKVIEALKND